MKEVGRCVAVNTFAVIVQLRIRYIWRMPGAYVVDVSLTNIVLSTFITTCVNLSRLCL